MLQYIIYVPYSYSC